MTTTVRSVRVELELGIASYVANARIAGRETDKAFSGAEERISGTSRAVSRLEKNTANLGRTTAEAKVGQTGLGREIENTGRSAGRAEASIDKYSGRLKTMLGLAAVLGPALLRLSAGALPAVTAGIAGLGAAGGGIAVTLLALHGVKDGLKALNDYELERTPENLAKVQQAFAELGPDGAHFVQTLRDLGPEIDHLQDISRAGVLPGFEDSLGSLETRLPIVSQIVNRLSQEVGRLAADAGDALASDEWTPFFEYVRSSAAPILDDFARSAGNVALGLANILVAFDPLTRGFTAGLEDMTSRFADWSQHLEDDKGFQDFLDTVEQAGPEVLDFLGSTVHLLTGLVRASAPLAQTTLPVLTGVVKVLAAIANSPIGPAIYTAAAAWTFYNRVATLAEAKNKSIQASWAGMSTAGKAGRAAAGIGLVAAAFTDYDDKAGLATTSTLGFTTALAGGGPLGIGAAVTVGLLIDITKANDDLVASTDDLNKAIASGDTEQMREQLALLRGEITETDDAADVKNLKDLIQIFPGALGLATGGVDKFGAAWSQLRGEENDAKDATDRATDALAKQKNVLASTTPLIGGVVNSLEAGADAAIDFSNALAILNGWFDKRDAVRGYKDAIDSLVKGLKDGFSREDAANIDAVGRSILQVAEQITNPKRKAAFLEGARAQLEGIAKRSGPEAAAAIQKVIDKFDSEGLTNPPPIKLTADQKDAEAAFASVHRDLHNIAVGKTEAKIDADDSGAQRTIRRTHLSLDGLNTTTAKPKVTVDPGNSLSILGSIVRMLGNVTDRSATVRITTITTPGGKEIPAPGGADGMTVPGPRYPYGDKVTIRAAPGEEIISNRTGQADRFRADRAAGRIPSYAGGGTVEDRIRSTYTTRYRGQSGDTATDPGMAHWTQGAEDAGKAADGAARSLKKLETAADKVQKSYDKQKAKLDDLISQRDSAASSIAANAIHDPFGNGLAGLDAQTAADQGDLDAMTAALATLVKNGLDPKSALYQQLAAHMDVNTAQQLAQLSSAELAVRAQRFQQLQTNAGAFGGQVAGQEFNEAIRDQTKATNKLENRLHSLEDAIHDLKNLPKDLHDAVFTGSHGGSYEGAWTGTRDAAEGRRRRVATTKRTG